MKAKIILNALQLGITVLIMDVDIVVFKDPLPYLDCTDCDIQISYDEMEANSGFYLARPTQPAIMLHAAAWAKGNSEQGEKISNQKLLNQIMIQMLLKKNIKYKTLNQVLFPNGYTYWEKETRMFYFDNPPKNKVIVHNNWIVSMHAKVYRFKEMLLWNVDTNGYYSDPNRKYLTYSNPLDFGDHATIKAETEALRNALAIAHILNRTLILPTFTCRMCEYDSCKVAHQQCAFNTHFSIRAFDSEFDGQYREHVFLDHPKVPNVIKKQKNAHDYVIVVDRIANKVSVDGRHTALYPKDRKKGATIAEILEWFGGVKSPVLKLHCLYWAFGEMENMENSFTIKLAKAFNLTTDYRQYDEQSLIMRRGSKRRKYMAISEDRKMKFLVYIAISTCTLFICMFCLLLYLIICY